jgi:hypothetical protein
MVLTAEAAWHMGEGTVLPCDRREAPWAACDPMPPCCASQRPTRPGHATNT